MMCSPFSPFPWCSKQSGEVSLQVKGYWYCFKPLILGAAFPRGALSGRADLPPLVGYLIAITVGQNEIKLEI